MTDAVTICNMALGHVGARSKVSQVFPSPENSEEARNCFIYYETARKAALESFDWQFASREVSLALYADDDTPVRWQYQYAWPDDCINPIEIIRLDFDDEPIAFATGISSDGTTKLIFTDEEDAALRFTADIENPTLFPATFEASFAWRLSMDLAIPLTRNRDVFMTCADGFAQSLPEARKASANRGRHHKQQKASWHKGRF